MRKLPWLGIALLGACGGDVDYLGLPPAEAASEAAETGCAIAFRCGLIVIDTDTQPCTGSYAPAETEYTSRAACETELAAYYVELFTGCAAANLSDAERADLNDCFNYDPGCYSESELDDLAAAACSGVAYGPESCQRAILVFQRCSTCANDPTDPACG
jgi:hypothetical protein